MSSLYLLPCLSQAPAGIEHNEHKGKDMVQVASLLLSSCYF